MEEWLQVEAERAFFVVCQELACGFEFGSWVGDDTKEKRHLHTRHIVYSNSLREALLLMIPSQSQMPPTGALGGPDKLRDLIGHPSNYSTLLYKKPLQLHLLLHALS